MKVEPIPFSASSEWRVEAGRLQHTSGGFFSVVGAHRINGDSSQPVEQPLILQPEIGILGFMIRGEGEESEILLQAKPEPGNIGLVQLAPSVQATESNYLRRHGGAATPFLDIFLQPDAVVLLSDSLQSEQGSRFLGKYNRNMLVRIPYRIIESGGDWLRWFAIKDLLHLLCTDYCVNTDARSVLASAPWDVLTTDGQAPFERWLGHGGLGEMLYHSWRYHDNVERAPTRTLGALERLRQEARPNIDQVPLSTLSGWRFADDALAREDGRSFSVPQFHVRTSQREVAQWDQPLAAASLVGRVVLLCAVTDGVLKFGFRPSPEIGFDEGVQLGPTLQDLGDEDVPSELQQRCEAAENLLCCMHSDEGGRFFQCVSEYSLRLASDDYRAEDPALIWLSLGEIATLIRIKGVFSNEARSTVSMLMSYL